MKNIRITYKEFLMPEKIKCVETGEIYESIRDACRETGVARTTIKADCEKTASRQSKKRKHFCYA